MVISHGTVYYMELDYIWCENEMTHFEMMLMKIRIFLQKPAKLSPEGNCPSKRIKVWLTLYLIETPLTTFANRADPDKAALVRAAWSGPSLFAYGNKITYDPTLVDLTSNVFFLCTNVKVHLYNYSQWVELRMNIHKGKAAFIYQNEIQYFKHW